MNAYICRLEVREGLEAAHVTMQTYRNNMRLFEDDLENVIQNMRSARQRLRSVKDELDEYDTQTAPSEVRNAITAAANLCLD